MDARTESLIKECQRQYDNCLYTAAALYTWQKQARFWRAAFLIAPIVLGGFAGSQILTEFAGGAGNLVAAFCGVLAGFFPAIYVALNLDMHLAGIGRSAAEFTTLRDRFRQAANVKAHAPFDEFQAEFEALMDRMDAARASAPPSPEWCFKVAQEKVKRGDYEFDVDMTNSAPREPSGPSARRV